jgi:mannose-6-phosphate isomerase-like protein (cupin superfamily)
MTAGATGPSLVRGQPKEFEMPKVSRESAKLENHGPVEDRHDDLEGYTVNFVTFKQDIDATPLMKGLPDDQCHCPHWGYVFKGRVTYRFADHEETVEAGDAFYVEPGHVPIVEAGTEFVQFSPKEELAIVSETMMRNAMAMMQGG